MLVDKEVTDREVSAEDVDCVVVDELLVVWEREYAPSPAITMMMTTITTTRFRPTAPTDAFKGFPEGKNCFFVRYLCQAHNCGFQFMRVVVA
jgi:hypothetical protein